ncbi:hypothetical protein DFH09DRAFT_1094376 [Mycena vulgaris]|nr:hypothetical protein DFH09DRAFT_1094376 [Mycena vulgaris]
MDAQGLSALGRLIWRNRMYDNWTQYDITKEGITGQREKPTMVNKNGEDRAGRGGNDKTGIFSKATRSISPHVPEVCKGGRNEGGGERLNAVARVEKTVGKYFHEAYWTHRLSRDSLRVRVAHPRGVGRPWESPQIGGAGRKPAHEKWFRDEWLKFRIWRKDQGKAGQGGPGGGARG